MNSTKAYKLPSRHSQEIAQIQFDENYICTAAIDKSLQLMDRRREEVILFEILGSVVTCMTMCDTFVALGLNDGTVTLRYFTTPSVANANNKHHERVSAIQILENRNIIISASNEIRVWSVHERMMRINIIIPATAPILGLQLTPCSLRRIIITAACVDGKLHFWILSGSDAVVSLGYRMTFESSFLPIMLYQNFTQLFNVQRITIHEDDAI